MHFDVDSHAMLESIAQVDQHRSRHSRAFTLVELLVVISIITLLIGILQPSLAKARESARRSVCGTQLRQQAIGMGSFANDNKHRYPQAAPTAHWPDGALTVNWTAPNLPTSQGILFSDGYVTDARLFYCPSNTHSASAWANLNTGWHPEDWRNTYVHYPYWATFRSAYDVSNTLAKLVADSPMDPSDRVLVTDNITLDTGPAHFNSASRNHLGQGAKPAGGNVALNDNSAHWRDFDETSLRVQVPPGAAHQRDFHF